jgi:putative transposase
METCCSPTFTKTSRALSPLIEPRPSPRATARKSADRNRNLHFSTEQFERYQRSEKALVSALAEMYVQGVSTCKTITEELYGHSFSASTISGINKGLDQALKKCAERGLQEACLYLILDARYEKVRFDGVSQSQAVLVAIGINDDGRRQILGVELSNRESTSS